MEHAIRGAVFAAAEAQSLLAECHTLYAYVPSRDGDTRPVSVSRGVNAVVDVVVGAAGI